MLWWFLILALSAGAVLWAGMGVYLRVHCHMKDTSKKETVEHEPDKI